MNQNMNENNNEQELMLKKKIEKREKTDIIIAYVLIVVLLACIALILVLKFTRKEEIASPEEYAPSYIGLSDIVTLLNDSTLAYNYLSDGATFRSSVSGNSLVVTYTKDDNIINMNVPVVDNELEFSMDDTNSQIVTDIYKEVANIVCVYYGNNEDSCRSTIANVNSNNSISGIRFVNDNIVYVDTINGIDVNTIITYSEVTKTSISNTGYILNLLDNKISNINITTNDADMVFSGTIERLTDDSSDLSVEIKLYDVNGTVISENKQEYNDSNPLNESSNFEVSFVFSDTLLLEDISEYSIEIIK